MVVVGLLQSRMIMNQDQLSHMSWNTAQKVFVMEAYFWTTWYLTVATLYSILDDFGRPEYDFLLMAL